MTDAARRQIERLGYERAASEIERRRIADARHTHTVYSRGRRYHAYSAEDARYIRDTVGGYIEAE